MIVIKGFTVATIAPVLALIALLQSHCVDATACGSTLRTKRFTISTPTGSQFPPTNCAYQITPSSLNVCQLRIEFNVLRLAPQTPNRNSDIHTCATDALRIPSMGLELCGFNDGQHIYVPFNVTNARSEVRLEFRITDRMTNPPPNAGYAAWEMRVTQLDCPRGSPRSAMSLETLVKEKRNMPAIDARTFGTGDAYWIAPFGCLQYYPDRSGTFQTFNYNNGIGPYLTNMNYAICFRRQSSDTRLVLTFHDFHMNAAVDGDDSNGNGNGNGNEEAPTTPTLKPGLDEDCHAGSNTPGGSNDYIFIPRAESFTHGIKSHFCGNIMSEDNIIYSTPPGPFYLDFHSDELISVPAFEKGFRATYSIS